MSQKLRCLGLKYHKHRRYPSQPRLMCLMSSVAPEGGFSRGFHFSRVAACITAAQSRAVELSVFENKAEMCSITRWQIVLTPTSPIHGSNDHHIPADAPPPHMTELKLCAENTKSHCTFIEAHNNRSSRAIAPLRESMLTYP
jgi:hypothetical protein